MEPGLVRCWASRTARLLRAELQNRVSTLTRQVGSEDNASANADISQHIAASSAEMRAAMESSPDRWFPVCAEHGSSGAWLVS